MSARQIVVVDVESAGLDPAKHMVVEVAWWNLSTGEARSFIPKHDVSKALAGAEVKALQINRYIDRVAENPQDEDFSERDMLFAALKGNTLAGSNPAFDAAFLRTIAETRGDAPWHYRLLDLAVYAAGVLHLPPTELPGLNQVCELLEVDNRAPHTAWGDVDATGKCFKKLMARAA